MVSASQDNDEQHSSAELLEENVSLSQICQLSELNRFEAFHKLTQPDFNLTKLKQSSQEEVNMVMMLAYMLRYVEPTISIRASGIQNSTLEKVVWIGRTVLNKNEDERSCALRAVEILRELKIIEPTDVHPESFSAALASEFKLTLYGNVLIVMLQSFCKQML